MARARNIKHAFFLNTELSDNHPLGRLLFIGLWTLADYKGCIKCDFKKIKAQVLPYDECDVEALMNNLEHFRFIRYYVVQGKRYIKIDNFERHQNPHKNEREAGSDIPDISEKDNENNDLKQEGIKPDLIGSARADSLSLITDSLIPESVEPATPSAIGLASIALTKAGLPPFNQSHQTFAALVDSGATPQEFYDAAIEIKTNKPDKFNFNYILSVVKGRRTEASNLKLHKGALPPQNSREAGRQAAARSIFKPEHTQHLMGNAEKEIENEEFKRLAN